MRDRMKAIAEIGVLLNQSCQSSEFPRGVLTLMASATGARRCRLFLLRYNAGPALEFHCPASFPAPVSTAVLPQERAVLDEQARYFAGKPEASCRVAEQDDARTFYFPLWLNGHLSCLLFLETERSADTGAVMDFISPCMPLIGLWNTAEDIRKTLDDVCDFTREPLYIMNTDGEVVLWNKAMAELSGWKASQIIGQGDRMNAVPFYGEKRLTVPHLILQPNPDFEKRHYMKFRREGDVVHALTFLPTVPHDGAYVSCKTQRLYDRNGVLHSAIHSLHDLTKLRQMEMDLHKLRFIGRLMNDLSETALVLLTKEGISYHNDKAAEILGLGGYRRPALEDLLAVVTKAAGDDREKLGFFLSQVVRFEEPGNPYVEFSAFWNGGMRDVRCNAHFESGEEPSVLLTFTDISREREIIAQAKENEMKVLRADRLSTLGVLSAGIAHEIAQPLSVIKVLADSWLYAREAGWESEDEDLREHFATISQQVGRMSKVIDGIRVFSRDEKEEGTAVSDLNQALANVMRILERQFLNYGIHIKAAYHGAPLIVRCGLSRLEQVVMTLMINARQALDGCDHSLKEICLTTAREKGHALLWVADNGPGICQDDLRKIFDPFFTTKEIGQGTGLGLTICKSITNLAGGDIEVWNNTGGGCTVQVSLPVAEGGDENTAD